MSRKVSKDAETIYNFQDLVQRYKTFGDNIAFQYKEQGKIQSITYNQYAEDIRALRNSNFKFGNRKNSCNWK